MTVESKWCQSGPETNQEYMIAKYSPWVAARAYTWPVEEEQCPFEDPVGFSPPLQETVLVYRTCCWCVSIASKSESNLVFPSASTAGKGTQPLVTLSFGLYLSIRLPATLSGAASLNPTTASWEITALASSGVEACAGAGAPMTGTAVRTRPMRTDRIDIMNNITVQIRPRAQKNVLGRQNRTFTACQRSETHKTDTQKKRRQYARGPSPAVIVQAHQIYVDHSPIWFRPPIFTASPCPITTTTPMMHSPHVKRPESYTK